MENPPTKPKVFVSYSWSSESHRNQIRDWADRLLADGVEVVIDQYDLKEGHDKNSFMERMVTDASVTHVLIFCDRIYAEKADARKAGVGTESQIISQEVYNKVDQGKFIPIVCELSPDGEPYLPVFVKSRIWLNFSSPELSNKNWEQLIRLLFGKPLFKKPDIGKPPPYVYEGSKTPSNPALGKFQVFKNAFLQGRPGIVSYRNDFLDACFSFADALRTRARPDEPNWGQCVLEVCDELVSTRDLLVDWLMLEGSASHSDEFSEVLHSVMERLLELRARPQEVTAWSESWFEAHKLFAWQMFLYVVALLLKIGRFELLNEIFFSHYLLPEIEGSGSGFDSFDAFYASSELLNAVLAPPGKKLYSPAAELIKRQATREDLAFSALIEAELLVFLASTLNPKARWYPQLLYYAGYGRKFPFFFRATQQKGFRKMATICNVDSADDLRNKVREGFERMGVKNWSDFNFHVHISLWDLMNMDKLDTLT